MSKVKTICFLISSFDGGGAEKQAALLLNVLQQYSDFKLQLIHFDEGVNFSRINLENIKVKRISTNSYYDPRNIIKVNKAVKSLGPDILFSWLPTMDIYARIIKKFNKNLKWIVAERDSSYASSFRNNLRNKWILKADHIIANSDNGRIFWKDRGIEKEDISVVNNILHIPTPSQTGLLKGKPIFLYVGRFTPQKNILFLTSVFCAMAKRNENSAFYLIGEGILKEEIEKIILENSTQEQVKILPFQKDVQNYFSSAHVFVSMSHHEGTPNTIIENVALGKTIVASKIKEHTDILGDSYPYLMENSSDQNALIDLLERACLNTDDESILEYGKNKIASFNAEEVSNNYIKIFNRIFNA